MQYVTHRSHTVNQFGETRHHLSQQALAYLTNIYEYFLNWKRTKLSAHELDRFLHVDDLESFPYFIVATTPLGIQIVPEGHPR